MVLDGDGEWWRGVDSWSWKMGLNVYANFMSVMFTLRQACNSRDMKRWNGCFPLIPLFTENSKEKAVTCTSLMEKPLARILNECMSAIVLGSLCYLYLL